MKKLLFILAFSLAILGSAAMAAEPTRIYIANDDHTDFMWTTDTDTYADSFVDLLDFHLKLADETAINPFAFRNRFTTDGSYWLWCYEQKKSPAEFKRLIARIKDGTISSPINPLSACYGGQPVEAVLRGMYYAGRLERRYDLRFPLATAMENQTLPLGLASLFAGAGASYSWRGVCGCASKLSDAILGRRDHEIYWYTGHDGQRVLMKWYSLSGAIGGYWEAGFPEPAIRYVETNQGFLNRYADPVSHEPYKVIGLFGFGGDDLARKTGVTPPPMIPGVPGLAKVVSSPYCDHFYTIAQKLTTPERQVIVSNEIDFFKDFESHYGKTLEGESVTYGNEWDLYTASMAETSARAKRAVEKLRTAELLATLVTLKYPNFMNHFSASRDRAFNALGLFWEHDWTADGPIARGHRAAWEEEVASEIESYVNAVQSEASVRLGGMIPRPAKAKRFFVLNPLGWPRTDFADHPYKGSANIHVRDVATGKDVPHQLVKNAGVSYLRILVSDVPSAGYKVYEILSGPGSAAKDDAAVISGDDGTTLENACIAISLDRDGAIRSLIDKRHGAAELAATIGGLKLNDFAANSDAGEPLTVVNRGPVSVTLRARSGAGLEHTTDITLFRDSERIDIRNEINENFGDMRYWAFSFALGSPAVHTEEVGGINLNKLKSEGGDYANRLARYDHVTVNHFADITAGNGTYGVTLSNPDLSFARLGASTVENLDTTTPQVSMLAGGQVDGSWLGIPNQNGQSRFVQRFALHAHGGYDPVAAMKFSLEHQNPLATGAVIGTDPGVYPADTYSLLSVSDPNVMLWTLKIAEEGPAIGVIARLWNLSEKPAKAEVALEPGLFAAQRTTHIETFIEPVNLTANGALLASFARQQLQTYRLIPRSNAGSVMTSR